MRAPLASLACCGALLGCGTTPKPPVVEVALPPLAAAAPALRVAAAEDSAAPGQDRHRARDVARQGRRVVQGQGYRYEVPATWEELDAAALGSVLIRHAQRAVDPAGGFAQNVNVATEPYAGDGPAYGADNLAELTKVSNIRDQHAARVGNRDGWDIEAQWPNAGGTPYVTLQRYASDGAHGFVITCSTGEGAFARNRGTCDEVLASFRLE